MSEPIYILGAARTPIGSFQGALAKQSAPELGAHAIQGALANAGAQGDEINEVIMGNVVSAGLKQAPARQAMRLAELPDGVAATTLNKVCGSGMKATMMAMDLIAAGSADTVVAGGMESMSSPARPRSTAFPPYARPSRATAPLPRPTHRPSLMAHRPWCLPVRAI
jgi:acetyl-CoA C-acetyltransferase